MSDVHRKDVELFRGLEPVLGADVATLLLERLPPPNDELATRADLERFATKEDFEERFATKQDLERFATKQDLERFATKDDLERLANKADVEQRFEQVDRRFEQVDRRFEQVDQRFDRLEESLDLRFAAQSAELKGFVHEIVGTQIQAQTRTILFGMAGIMFGATTLAVALGQVV